MPFSAKILADSLHPLGTDRLTTMELTYPRFIHSEFMTHRMFSRNSASSRAIPVEKMLANIESDPVIPISWGKNQKGMQAGEEMAGYDKELCEGNWLWARDQAVIAARGMLERGLHKQITNRLVEPWMWITVICTGNKIAYSNFFKLRCHPDAEPHMQKLAYLARDTYQNNGPRILGTPPQGFDGFPEHVGKTCWHLPLMGFEGDDNLPTQQTIKVCIGRCARVSYLTHMGTRDTAEDIRLHDRLVESGHWSPFEHAAFPNRGVITGRGGNFGPHWVQYRKLFAEECAKA